MCLLFSQQRLSVPHRNFFIPPLLIQPSSSSVFKRIIERLTRSHFKFCLLIHVFRIGLCGHWLLAVSQYAVQYLWQRVIIYCRDQHSSQCSNWKLYWSCKYSTLRSLPWGGMAVFPHVVSSHVVHLAHCRRGSGTLTQPKQAIPQKKKIGYRLIDTDRMHKFCSFCTAWFTLQEGR